MENMHLSYTKYDNIRFANQDSEDAFRLTMVFALAKTARMKNFFRTVNYLLNWGRGDDGEKPVSIVIGKDWTEHSFGFSITTYKYDEDAQAIVNGGGIFIMMYYRKEDDRWETHS